MPTLFDPIQLGAIHAPNRVLMAPLTRGRSTQAHVPTKLMAEYYAQRASSGLIISEATGITHQGLGWPYAPGIWNQAQVDAWRPVTEAVHHAGGRIMMQLWHMGRLVHPSFLGGEAPVSSVDVAAPGKAHTYTGKQPYGAPRALRVDEIPAVLDDYRHAARNAMQAGFDGVQVHAANGYLIDQFLRDNTNTREDAYGGSVANRIRLLTEVVQAVADTVGADLTAVRLSPNGFVQGVDDSDPETLFTAAATTLSAMGLAFLELREPFEDSTFVKAVVPRTAPAIKRAFRGQVILNSDYDGASGQAMLDSGVADAIAFGRPFIGNPDLPARLKAGHALAKDEMATWYSQGAEGYTDYPVAA